MSTDELLSDSVTTVSCFEGCGEEIKVASWEDNTRSGNYLPVCSDCDEDRPEGNLWDASNIEESGRPLGSKELCEHPIPDGEEWTVVDTHRYYRKRLYEIYGDDIPDDVDKHQPDETRLEIFIRDPEDEEALEAARDEARRRLNEDS